MTDFTEETKTQSPHWKSEDITTRKVTRGKVGNLSRGKIADSIHNELGAEVVRMDIENAYGDKPTIDHIEETKGTVDHTEGSKGTIDHNEESKSTISYTEETKPTIDWTEESK